MITNDDIKQAKLLFPSEPKTQWKPIWLLDCFKYRITPEECDPKGCGECNHYKELKEKYEGS